jgi:hypothetical protein
MLRDTLASRQNIKMCLKTSNVKCGITTVLDTKLPSGWHEKLCTDRVRLYRISISIMM